MDYWAETMQDDCLPDRRRRLGGQDQPHRGDRQEGQDQGQGWACDLIPKPFIVARYFAKEQAAIEALQAELEAAIGQPDRAGRGARRRRRRVCRLRQASPPPP